jgi:hypothetical protein
MQGLLVCGTALTLWVALALGSLPVQPWHNPGLPSWAIIGRPRRGWCFRGAFCCHIR